MASPQKENGYTAIANETVEALARFRIPGEARQVLDFILRKTYGYNKLDDRISLSQFVLGTGLKRSNVCRGIEKLILMNLIIRSDTTKGGVYRFNKDFGNWKALSKQIPRGKALSEPITEIIQSDNQLVSEAIHTKVDITKVDTKENRSEAQIFNQELFRYGVELIGTGFKDEPTARIKFPKLIRQKFKDIEIVKSAMYRAHHQKSKAGFYYWREGRMTLAKLYYRLIQEYIDDQKGKEQAEKLYAMRQQLKLK